MSHNRKKDVSRSKVRGVEIIFDHLQLASILGIPGNNGICEYIKEVWEESRYTKPLEITRRFANDYSIMEARRVKSVKMKPFQRFIHFLVKKNVVPHFGKRDTTSYMDLIYMDHLIARRLVNLPRVMMRHMSYVILVKDHELPYGVWLTMVFEEFRVPLVDKKGEELKRYDYFEETFLTMCKLARENGVWWIGTGENRRRDDDNEAPAKEVHEEEEGQNVEFDWEVVIDEVADQGESGSGEKFYDAEDEIQEPAAVVEEVPTVVAQASAQQKETEAAGVDPSGPSGRIPESVMNKDDDGHDGGNDGKKPTAQEHVQTPSVNATEVVDNNDNNDEDVVNSASQDPREAAKQIDDAEGKDDETRNAVEEVVDVDDDDDEEDNMSLSTGFEALRREEVVDDDDVSLCLKYQTTPQELITVDANLEIASVNADEMEVEIVEQNISTLDDEEELFGIDDVEALIEIEIKKTFDDIF
ncbi:hypothetical protein Dimus_028949 [Dionaea muscipula]